MEKRAEKKLREKANTKNKDKEEYSMMFSWCFILDDFNKETVNEIDFMAIIHSYIEESKANSVVRIIDFKEKLHFLSKRKPISLMNDFIDDFQESTSNKDKLFSVLTSLKFDYTDLKTFETITNKEKSTLKDHISQLDSNNMILQSTNLKLFITKKGE